MKPHPKIIDRILEKIRESQTICVVGHLRPDGDCIGSQLALALEPRRRPEPDAGAAKRSSPGLRRDDTESGE